MLSQLIGLSGHEPGRLYLAAALATFPSVQKALVGMNITKDFVGNEL